MYKRQGNNCAAELAFQFVGERFDRIGIAYGEHSSDKCNACLLYTSDAADERSSVDLGGRRIIKKKKKKHHKSTRNKNETHKRIVVEKESNTNTTNTECRRIT